MPFSFLRIDQFRFRIQHINTNWSIDPKGGTISTCSLGFAAASFTYLRRLGLFFGPVVTAGEEYLWLRFVSAHSYLLLAAVYLLVRSLIEFAFALCLGAGDGEGEGVQWTRKLGNSATENPETRVSRQSLANFFPSFICFRFWSLSRIIRRMVNGSVAEQWRRALLNFIFFSVVFLQFQ